MKRRTAIIITVITLGIIPVIMGSTSTKTRCNYIVHNGTDDVIAMNLCSIEEAFDALPNDQLETCTEEQCEYLLDRIGWADSNYPGIYLRRKNRSTSHGAVLPAP